MSRGPVGTTTRARARRCRGRGGVPCGRRSRRIVGVPTRWSRTVRAPKRRERSTVGQPYVCVLLMSGITDLRVDLDTVRRLKTRSRSAQPCRDNLCKCRTGSRQLSIAAFSTSVPQSLVRSGPSSAGLVGEGPYLRRARIWVRASRTASRMLDTHRPPFESVKSASGYSHTIAVEAVTGWRPHGIHSILIAADLPNGQFDWMRHRSAFRW